MSMTEKVQKEYKEMVAELKQQRDELRVKMHLANMEVKEEWEEMEKKWKHFLSKNKQVGKVVGDTAEDTAELTAELGREIKRGYNRIKDLL